MSQVIVILTATDLIRQDDGLFSLDNVTKHSFKIDRRLLEAKLVIYSNGL